MPSPNDTLRAMRDAVRLAPDNVPLRIHFAETLMAYGHPEAAEQQFQRAIKREPNNDQAKLGLARAYYQQKKDSHATVVIEGLIRRQDPPAEAYVLHARLLIREGDEARAARQYRTAIDMDPSVKDDVLAKELGVRPLPQFMSDEEDDEDFGDITPDGRMRIPIEGESGTPEADMERPSISFQDVGGMEKLKEEIRMKIIHPMAHPEIYESYGKKIGGGILMYGPPGCGKTYLARATAGQVKAGFVPVGIHDVLDMYIGNSEHHLHALFQQARNASPCVLFFDEVDALGASRTDMKHSHGRMLINQFLSELDGVQDSNDGVLILAATNAPWHLDSAFRRPGRFDRVLFVPPPDREARREILQILIRGKPTEDVDFDVIAKKTEGFSGADLKAVIDVTVEAKLREAMSEGMPKPILTKDLKAAIKEVKPSTKEWFATARNYALYSNQGGIYNDILEYLKMK